MSRTQCRILDHSRLPGDWVLLRVETDAATQAGPGHSYTIVADGERIHGAVMHTSDQGWIALLVPPVLADVAESLRPHQACDSGELEDTTFDCRVADKACILIGECTGIGAILLLAQRLPERPRLVLLGGDRPMPFRARPSRFLLPAMPPEVIAAAPAMEDLGIPSRIAQRGTVPGCFDGGTEQLLAHWLGDSDAGPLQVYAAGAFGIEQRLRRVLQGQEADLQVRLLP